jgi:hypothetical protein
VNPFVKVILPSSYSYSDALTSLVDVHSSGIDSAWMKKRATAGVFKNIDIKPDKDNSYLHLIAMGDAEYWSQNRNGDAFFKTGRVVDIPHPHTPSAAKVIIEKGNVDTYHTFKKHGHVFRNHVNKDPEKAEGTVVEAAHNDDMNRIELIIKVPNEKWASEIEDIANGKDVPFSMATKVPYDYCTECGNKARNRQEYCDHAKNHMGEITKEGNQIGVMNDHMVYFDISRVVVPADRIAFGLLKAAGAASVMSGAEMAEQMALFPPLGDSPMLLDKLAALRKLSEMEKEIEVIARPEDNECMRSFDPDVYVDDLPEKDIKVLGSCMRSQVPDVLGALADVKIVLSLKDFMRILFGNNFDRVEDHIGSASQLMPGIFGRIMAQPFTMLSGADDFDLGNGVVPKSVREIIGSLKDGKSLSDAPVQRRITITVLRGKSPRGMAGPVTLEKSSSASKVADRLAVAYALYKAAVCRHVGLEDPGVIRRIVLSNYIL